MRFLQMIMKRQKKTKFRYFCAISVVAIIIVVASSVYFTIKPSHTKYGTNYGNAVIKKYSDIGSYSYINKFIVPYLFPELGNLKSKKLLDVGCGVGLWAIYAAKHGVKVYGIDIQPGMIKQAKDYVQEENLNHLIELRVGDAALLPYKEDFFDEAISINVVCNLPIVSFYKHFNAQLHGLR